MAVPASIGEYLDDVVAFLQEYQWSFKCPNTHLFVDKVFDKLPSEWVSFLSNLATDKLNNFAKGLLPEDAPKSLQSFFEKLNRLKFEFDKAHTCETFQFPNNSRLSRKKQHEIQCLAPLIDETCKKSACDLILDVGTGLGYLPRLLYDKYKYRSIGIEGSPEKVELAKMAQNKHPESSNSIQYVEHFVTESSQLQIKQMLQNVKMSGACITGLHACADLSVTILEIFASLDEAKSLVIMPCCYHRLVSTDVGFPNFPASVALKQLWEKYNAGEFLKVPFLRLACQNSVDEFCKMTNAQHVEHANSCLFRAILQEVGESEKYQVRRLKRKSGKLLNRPSDMADPFESYLANLKHTHALIGGEISDPQFLRAMREKWTQHKGKACQIEALAAIQAAMQSVCENVVLLDRVMCLEEKGLECSVVKVTEHGISPRCHALIARKR